MRIGADELDIILLCFVEGAQPSVGVGPFAGGVGRFVTEELVDRSLRPRPLPRTHSLRSSTSEKRPSFTMVRQPSSAIVRFSTASWMRRVTASPCVTSPSPITRAPATNATLSSAERSMSEAKALGRAISRAVSSGAQPRSARASAKTAPSSLTSRSALAGAALARHPSRRSWADQSQRIGR